MASKNKNAKSRKKNFNDKSIRSIDKNLENSKVFDTKKLMAKHANDSSLEETNVQEFHFDDTMLNDFDSLDTSFIDNSSNSKKKKIARKEFNKRSVNKKIKVKKTKFRSVNFVAFAVVVLLAIFLGGILTYLCFYNKINKTKIVTKVEVEEKMIVDENVVFLGDSLFDRYDLDEYYPDNKVVNSGIDGNTTTNILEDMTNRVYRYNPSKVFILIGTNDLQKEESIDEISDNLKEIVTDIKKNRKYSDIYVLSLLPVNENDEEDKVDSGVVGNRNNDDIKKVNVEYKKICKDEKVNYVDVFDKLADENGNLDIDYTKEGLHLSDEGYEVLTNCIKKYLN